MTNKQISEFKTYLINEEKSKATVEKYVRDISVFSSWLAERELEKSVVLEYKERIMGLYAPRSVNSVISSLNAFFEFICRTDCKIKTLKIQRCIFADKEKELTKSEYDRLLTAAKNKNNDRLYYLMQTICAAGIRVSELYYITKESLKDGVAQVHMKGKLRIIIIPDKLCKMLDRYAKEQGITSGSIFITKSGKPLDRSHIWRLMKSLCESAGVDKKKVFPHNLRHLFARTFYSIEKDIVRLADILGHSSVNTTRIYTMETWEICRRQVQRLGLLRC